YISDQFLIYKGAGLYDTRALRAAYTGYVELDPTMGEGRLGETIKNSGDGKSVLVLANGRELPILKNVNEQFTNEVKIDDIRKAILGNNGSLWQLNADNLNKNIAILPYKYCTDVDVGGEPSCNRWDLGTDDKEIAKYYIGQYRKMYPVLNTVGKRLSIVDSSRYLSQVFTNLFAVRGFLDETFYLATSGESQSVWLPTALGAVEGLNFFSQIIGTPSISEPFRSEKRFAVHEIEEKNASGEAIKRKILVESKSNGDIATPGFPNVVNTRGIELDKAIALMMLTERNLGNSRYETVNLRLSYAELEKYLLGISDPAESIVFSTIKGILTDNPSAMTHDENGEVVTLPRKFAPTIPETVRYYAALGASVLLDADTLEDKDNFANLFRVGSSQKNVPSNRFSVTKLDQSPQNETSLKLWAIDSKTITSDMIEKAASQRFHIENLAVIGPRILKVVDALNIENADPAVATGLLNELTGELSRLDKESSGLILTSDLKSQGATIEAISQFAVEHAIEILSNAQIVAQEVANGKKTIDELRASLTERLAKDNELAAKELQIAGLVQKVIFGTINQTMVDLGNT
ncbi:MAG: hypothetical protein ACK5WZ_15200, partial [Pseudobdellovibrionaceae bacterium]